MRVPERLLAEELLEEGLSSYENALVVPEFDLQAGSELEEGLSSYENVSLVPESGLQVVPFCDATAWEVVLPLMQSLESAVMAQS